MKWSAICGRSTPVLHWMGEPQIRPDPGRWCQLPPLVLPSCHVASWYIVATIEKSLPTLTSYPGKKLKKNIVLRSSAKDPLPLPMVCHSWAGRPFIGVSPYLEPIWGGVLWGLDCSLKVVQLWIEWHSLKATPGLAWQAPLSHFSLFIMKLSRWDWAEPVVSQGAAAQGGARLAWAECLGQFHAKLSLLKLALLGLGQTLKTIMLRGGWRYVSKWMSRVIWLSLWLTGRRWMSKVYNNG